MLDQILQYVKEQSAGNLASEHNLNDNDHNEVFKVAQNSVTDALKSQAMSGNLGGLLDLFNGKADTNVNSNPVAGGMMQSVVAGLMDKLGLDEAKAGGIANTIVPQIINRFASPDTGVASDAGDLMKKIGFDGDTDMMDVVKNFAGGGSILDKVKGLFGGK